MSVNHRRDSPTRFVNSYDHHSGATDWIVPTSRGDSWTSENESRRVESGKRECANKQGTRSKLQDSCGTSETTTSPNNSFDFSLHFGGNFDDGEKAREITSREHNENMDVGGSSSILVAQSSEINYPTSVPNSANLLCKIGKTSEVDSVVKSSKRSLSLNCNSSMVCEVVKDSVWSDQASSGTEQVVLPTSKYSRAFLSIDKNNKKYE